MPAEDTQFRPKPGIDWEPIKDRFRAGETAHQIAKSVDVTAQSIAKRAKKEGWFKVPAAREDVIWELTGKELWIKDLAERDLFTPECAARMLGALKAGATFKLAAATAGVTVDTLSSWRKASPGFQKEVTEAMAQAAMKAIKQIDGAANRDWKAAERMLTFNPLTKDEVRPSDGGRQGPVIQVNIGIDRTKGGTEPPVIDVTPAE